MHSHGCTCSCDSVASFYWVKLGKQKRQRQQAEERLKKKKANSAKAQTEQNRQGKKNLNPGNKQKVKKQKLIAIVNAC